MTEKELELEKANKEYFDKKVCNSEELTKLITLQKEVENERNQQQGQGKDKTSNNTKD